MCNLSSLGGVLSTSLRAFFHRQGFGSAFPSVSGRSFTGEKCALRVLSWGDWEFEDLVSSSRPATNQTYGDPK